MFSRFEYTNDAQMVSALMAGDEGAMEYVFYKNYNSLLRLNYKKATSGYRANYDDLIQNLYLFISADNWEKLRRYDASKSPFANWFSVVSYRFFKDSVRSMIDSSPQVPIEDMNDHDITLSSGNFINTLMMDIKDILKKFKPPRDREILTAFLIYDEEPDSIAKRIGVTIDNLYNIKRRALERLRQNYLIDYAAWIMKNNIITPTDEQLAEYLNGTSNENDSLIVKRYLEENNDAVDDMLNIAIATVVQNKRSSSLNKRKTIMLYPGRWAIAASVALVLITGGFLMFRNPTSNPTIIASTDPEIKMPKHVNNTPSESETTENAIIPTTNHQSSNTNGITVRREEHITASDATAEKQSIAIIFPRRKHEAIPVDTDITFRWQSDATSLTLTIMDDKGVKLIQTPIPSNGSYTIPAQKVENADEIRWIISVANSAEQSGTIAIVQK